MFLGNRYSWRPVDGIWTLDNIWTISRRYLDLDQIWTICHRGHSWRAHSRPKLRWNYSAEYYSAKVLTIWYEPNIINIQLNIIVFSKYVALFAKYSDKLLALAGMACPMWHKARNVKETVVKCWICITWMVRIESICQNTEYLKYVVYWIHMNSMHLAQYSAKIIPNIRIWPNRKKSLIEWAIIK